MNLSPSKLMEQTRTTPARRDSRLGSTGLRFASMLCLSLAATVGCGDDFGGNKPEGSAGTAGSEQGGASASKGGSTAKGGNTAKGGTSTKPSSGGSNAGGSANGGDSGTTGGVAVGGTSAATGGTSAATGGTSAATGGTSAATGGTSAATGGTSAATGGASAATGGTGAATGGTGAAVGGTSAATGGTTAASTTEPPPVPPPAVGILKYEFTTVADTVATDSLNTHHGTLNQVTLADSVGSGRNGGGVTFANASADIAMPTALLDQSAAVSVSAWVKLSANAAGNRLFTFSNGTAGYLYLALNDAPPSTGGTGGTGGAGGAGGAGGTTDGGGTGGVVATGGTTSAGGATSTATTSTVASGISLVFRAPGGEEKVLTTKTQLPLNVWKHVTVTAWGHGAALYVDGKVVAQDNTLAFTPSALGVTTDDVVGNSADGTVPFQGQMDEFYLYDGLLTRSEILTLAAPKTDYSIYHFDEGTGTTAADSSTRIKNGELKGGATWVPGVFGGAVKLDNGTTGPGLQYVDLADGIVDGCVTEFTVAGWVNFETYAGHANADLFSFAYDANEWLRVSPTYNATTDLTFEFRYPTISGGVRAVPAVYTTRTTHLANTAGWSLGTWNHIAVVRRTSAGSVGRGLDMYVNGVLLGSNEAVGTGFGFNNWTGAFAPTMNYFGRSRDGSTNPGLDATLDEMLISCRNYTADEIKQLAYKP